ncbi:MAG: GGDEF domain-containing protein [Acidobacteria bacterium]|nr:GGDEF domain-containing protein [Acidobacteriota bacterium]
MEDAAFGVRFFGAILFALAFLFLWTRSRILFFAFWTLAWVAQAVAIIAARIYFSTGGAFWVAPALLFECLFGVLLVAAARVGPGDSRKDWKPSMLLLIAWPGLLAPFYLAGRPLTPGAYQAFHAVLLSAVYLYSYLILGPGKGADGKLFRGWLLLLSVAFLARVAAFLFGGRLGLESTELRDTVLYSGVLHAGLVFAAMAMWIDGQGGHIQQLGDELDRVRRESAANLDRLTGLLNQTALEQRLEDPAGFSGLVAVCDMDNFKQVNDRFGHLVGDEILRAVGSLIRSSIRQDDEAFRWGGDEFVILFKNLNQSTGKMRMEAIRARLEDFRVRGYGVLPITFSWGLAESDHQPLRQPLEAADREMYEFKRRREGHV